MVQLEASSQNIQGYFSPLDEQGLQVQRPTYRDVSDWGEPSAGAHRADCHLEQPAHDRHPAGGHPPGYRRDHPTCAGLGAFHRSGHLDADRRSGRFDQHRPGPDSAGSCHRTALQITRADDLSRRIPYKGPPDDEVGQLIRAFNQTLGRLENLFNSQRRFLADVGHELRTPLTVINGNVDLMRRMRSIDDESMDSIESEVDRLTRLVGDLLLLAQAESGKLPLVKATVEMDSLVFEVLQPDARAGKRSSAPDAG